MSITAGYHKIKTSSGKYLTLLTQTGTLTAAPDNGAPNQTWDLQPSGNNWTIKNNGYALTTYAYSNGQDAAPVTGNTLSTEWCIVRNAGNYSIQLGSNTSVAWNVGSNQQVNLAGTQLQNVAQQFAIISTSSTSISSGNHKIKTSSGNYVTLLPQSGTLIAVPDNGATNQIWDFQPSGNNWIIKNTGYDCLTIYAYSCGRDAASLSGDTLTTEWFILPNAGNYSILLGVDTSLAWNVRPNQQVNLAVTQLQNAAQQFAIE